MREEKIFTFRVDSKILDYLKERADRNSRSIAKELEFIVKQLYIQESREFENVIKNLFSAYEKEKNKNISLREVMEDDSIQSPLKDAANELINFVKNL